MCKLAVDLVKIDSYEESACDFDQSQAGSNSEALADEFVRGAQEAGLPALSMRILLVRYSPAE